MHVCLSEQVGGKAHHMDVFECCTVVVVAPVCMCMASIILVPSVVCLSSQAPFTRFGSESVRARVNMHGGLGKSE